MSDFWMCYELSCLQFPSNLWIGLGGCGIIVFLHVWGRNKAWVRWFSGMKCTLGIMGGLVLLLLPAGIFAWPLYRSWPFILLEGILLVHLELVILRRWPWRNRWDGLFVLNHLGIWIALFAALFGAPDIKTLKMVAPLNRTEYVGLDQVGKLYILPFSITLKKFEVEYDDPAKRVPRYFCSHLLLQGKEEKQETEVRVNAPVEFEGYKIYQEGYEVKEGKVSEYVILKLVWNPWLPVVYTGIGMMIAGAVGMIGNGTFRKKRYVLGME